jgi:ferrochelatase
MDAHLTPPVTGILLCNTGTPAAPTTRAIRAYLAQFLSDQRIIEAPRWLWLPILHGIILNTRPVRSAKLYRRIWTENGAPLLTMMCAQAEALRDQLFARTHQAIPVVVGMRYGDPSIASGLRQLREAGVRRLLVLPLFPQYSATTTAAMFDAVFSELKMWRWMPEIRTIAHYHDHPDYITALANTVREARTEHGTPEKLLFSFHGIPQSYFLKGDPYYCECQKTARLVAEQLGLSATAWDVAFQSRFGSEPWLQPYTDVTLATWGHAKLKSVHVLCPGFAADCLETIDEIGHEGRHTYTEAGGTNFHYIPALNTRPDHLTALTKLVLTHLQGWLDHNPSPLPDPHRVTAHRQKLGLEA